MGFENIELNELENCFFGNEISGSSFVKKLHIMVSSCDNSIISWCKDGKMFEVKDPKRLELEVLPKFFRHARFQSLVRQLNFYDFKKSSKERSSWIYSHEFFKKGKPEILEYLKRKTNSSSPTLLEKRSINTLSPRSSKKNARGNSFTSDDSENSDFSPQNESLFKHQISDHDSNKFPRYFYNWEFAIQCLESRVLSLSSKEKFEDAEIIKIHLKDNIEDDYLSEFFLFLIIRNPFDNSSDLLHDVQLFLNTNLTIIDEINLYLMALHPKNGKVSESILKYREVIFMRSFMMFAIMKLQTSFDLIENINHPLKNALYICQQKWFKFANLFI